MGDKSKRNKLQTAAVLKSQCHTSKGKKKIQNFLTNLLNNPNNDVYDEDSAEWIQYLLAGGVVPEEYFKCLKSFDNSNVCGLVWNANFVAYRCRDCGVSPCMSLCADCFLSGNHAGHDSNMFKSQAGGACDCGDETVMKREGFCQHHSVDVSKRVPPSELTEMPQLIVPQLLVYLYRKVEKEIVEKELLLTVINPLNRLLQTLSELSAVDVLRNIIYKSLVVVVDNKPVHSSLPHPNQIMFSTQALNGRQFVRTAAVGHAYDGSFTTENDFPEVKPVIEEPVVYHESSKQTYLEYLMELLIKTEFHSTLAMFLLHLLPNAEYKELFTRLFCRQYTAIGTFLSTSLNPDLLANHMVHVSVQLFSNEVLACKMVKEENLLAKVIFVLNKMVGQCIEYYPVELEDRDVSVMLVDCSNKILKDHCYWPISSDLTNILSHRSIAKFFLETDDCLNHWMQFVKMITCMNINCRKTLVHAEYESKLYYISFSIEFECVAAVMWEIYRVVSKLNEKAHAVRMVQVSLDLMKADDLPGKLKKSSFTYHLSLQRYYALFVSQAVHQFDITLHSLSYDLIDRTLNYLLNVLVSTEEIRADVWLYNGHQICCQVQSYLQSYFCASMLDLDVFLVQICVCQMNADEFIERLLDRFSIHAGFHFSDATSTRLEGHEKFMLLATGFVRLLHMILTHRVYSASNEEHALRKDIIANLSVANYTHSQLTDLIPSRPGNTHTSIKYFDSLLQKVANYDPPVVESSNLHQGTYSLKDEVWLSEYDFAHVQMRVYKKSHHQNSLRRYNAVIKKNKLSLHETNWPPLAKPEPIHPAFAGVYKLLGSVKLQKLLITLLHKVVNCGSTSETLVCSLIHLLQMCATNSYPEESSSSVPKVAEGIGELTIEYIENCHLVDRKRDFCSKINQLLSEEGSEIDVTFRVCHHSSKELFHSLCSCVQEMMLHGQPDMRVYLPHIRYVLLQLPHRRYILVKRLLQYWNYYLIQNNLSWSELPIIKYDIILLKTIQFIKDHFGFLFQVCTPLLHFPSHALDLPLPPHQSLCENASIPLNSCSLNTDESLNFVLLNFKFYDNVKDHSKRPDNTCSVLALLAQLRKQLEEKSSTLYSDECTVGNGVFYVTKLLRTLCNGSDTNTKILNAICPEVLQPATSSSKTTNEVQGSKKDRKILGVEKQKKLLAEFEAKQRKFLENVKVSTSTMESVDDVGTEECVICFQKSPPSDKKAIGLIVYLQASAVLGKRMSEENTGACCNDVIGLRRSELFKITSARYTVGSGYENGIHFQTCGHHVHVDCHEAYFLTLQEQQQNLLNINKEEFSCPLCRGLSNCVLPIIPLHMCTETSFLIKLGSTWHAKCKEICKMLQHFQKSNMSKLKKLSFDVSVLSASMALIQNLLEKISKKGAQFPNDGLFAACIRYNLEDGVMQGGLVAQKKGFLLNLFHALHFISQKIFSPMVTCWNQLVHGDKNVTNRSVPLLLVEPASLLIELLLTWPRLITEDEVHCVIRAVYNLVFVQSLVIVGLTVQAEERECWYRNADQVSLVALATIVWKNLPLSNIDVDSGIEISQSVMSLQSVEYKVQRHCLPFLRIAQLFSSLWSRNKDSWIEGSFQSCIRALHLPSIITDDCDKEEILPLITSWCDSLKCCVQEKNVELKNVLPPVINWRPAKLIPLPELYDGLFQQYRKRKCKRCCKHPESPTICLVCGEFLCFHGSCCINENSIYECVQHSIDCGLGTGLFLVISSSVTLVIREDRICLWGSVYLDSFGEEDRELRRGKPLYLSAERYRLLEQEWRTHTLDKSSKKWGLHLNLM